jgi:LysR family hydrogen peroxide-inducible transcriptional activator
MPPLSLRQIQYFVALAEAGQYLRAAGRLGISQPSLSQQIAALEHNMQVTLVERRRGGIVLTPAGRAALVQARQVIDAVEGLASLADGLRDGLGGTLRLGTTPTIGPYLLPQVVRQLSQHYPDLKLVVRDGPPRDLREDLHRGVHDLILTQLPVPDSTLQIRRLFRDPLRLAVPRDHRLAGLSQVRDVELTGEDVLTLSAQYALHDQIAALCRDVGANLRKDYEGTSLDALRQMVAMGMGVTLLPALYVRSEVTDPSGDVAIVKLKGSYFRSVGLAWRMGAGQPEVFERFADLVDNVARRDFAGIVIPDS